MENFTFWAVILLIMDPRIMVTLDFKLQYWTVINNELARLSLLKLTKKVYMYCDDILF